MPTRQTGRILLTSLLVVQLLVGYVGQASTASAQIIKDPINTTTTPTSSSVPTYTGGGVEESLRQYLCVPEPANIGTDLYNCITKLYRFGIAFGAIALVFFVVFAGYVYITGGEASKGKGKSILLSALTGMAIILSSYVLLNFINPDLVKIKVIQPPIFTAVGLPKCEDVGFGVNCIQKSGQVNSPGGGTSGTGPGSGKCEYVASSGGEQCKAGCDRGDVIKCDKTYDSIISSVSSSSGVDANFIRAIIQQESQWRNGLRSPVGAQGLMQIMPDTWKGLKCSGDPYDPTSNITCGAKGINDFKRTLNTNNVVPPVGDKLRYIAAAYNGGYGKGYFKWKPSACTGRYAFECPLNAAKNACVSVNAEMNNYAVSVERYYNEYKAGKCK